jgi:hypothetical protein
MMIMGSPDDIENNKKCRDNNERNCYVQTCGLYPQHEVKNQGG